MGGDKKNDSGACGVSAPVEWANAPKKDHSSETTGVKSEKLVNQKKMISSGELLPINSRFCGGYSWQTQQLQLQLQNIIILQVQKV